MALFGGRYFVEGGRGGWREMQSPVTPPSDFASGSDPGPAGPSYRHL